MTGAISRRSFRNHGPSIPCYCGQVVVVLPPTGSRPVAGADGFPSCRCCPCAFPLAVLHGNCHPHTRLRSGIAFAARTQLGRAGVAVVVLNYAPNTWQPRFCHLTFGGSGAWLPMSIRGVRRRESRHSSVQQWPVRYGSSSASVRIGWQFPHLTALQAPAARRVPAASQGRS